MRLRRLQRAATRVGGHPFVAWLRRVLDDFVGVHCSMYAAGLTYFSMLAVVPIVCLLLVGAKSCGADEYARRQINGYLDRAISSIEHGQDDDLAKLLPTTDEHEREARREAACYVARQIREFTDPLFARIQRFDMKTFGWIGFGMLVWTVISSIGMVELSFNEIWRVAKARALWRRALLYLGLVLGLPFVLTIVMSPQILGVAKAVVDRVFGSVWLTKWVSDGFIWLVDSWAFRFATSFGVAALAFAFLLWLIPNCRVRFRHALGGGALTALLFGGWLKLCTVAQVGLSKSSAMYGSLALLPIVLTWLYMSWQIVLLGACVAHAAATKSERKEIPQ